LFCKDKDLAERDAAVTPATRELATRTDRLVANVYAALNTILSDGVDGPSPTASQCAKLVLLRTRRGKEPPT